MKRLTAILLLTSTALLNLHAQEPTELTSSEAKTLYRNTTKKRVSVHDPSITYNPANKRYYIVGTHKSGAYTTDLKNWVSAPPTWRTATKNNCANSEAFVSPAVKKVMKGGEEVDFPAFDAQDWAKRTDSKYTVDGNMWAPDVIWNEKMQKWCMYLSINGDQWHSSIILLTGDSPIGPFLYQGPVVISGFDNGSHTFKDTDVPLVLGDISQLPTRYTSYSNYGRRWPNCIDPCVFYDEEGKLWMSYGSWSGGIWMLELDEETGLRDYDVSYPLTGSGDGITQDPYFGKKIAGGYYVSGEASYIEHVGDYYYLFVTYGGLDSKGGYVMRVFRSKKPNGPYKDAAGHDAIFTEYKLNFGGSNADTRGMKIIGPYNDWGFMTTGELAQGHNSVLAAEDGRTYLVYHTRFTSANMDFEGFEVRVHQLFLTQHGWLVAAPFEYNGETLTDQDIATRQLVSNEDVAGTYDIIIHKYAIDHANQEVVTPVQVTLTPEGKVTGKYVGTWSIEEGTSYLTIRLGATTYKGVIFEEEMDQKSVHAISFTACANTGVNVWGYKKAPKYALAWQLNNQKMPVTNNGIVKGNLDLDGIWQGDPNVNVAWTSSQPDIINEHGRYNPTNLQEDTEVTLTAHITSGGYFWQQEYNVKALSEANAAPTADWQTGMLAHYGFDDEQLSNTFNPQETASLQRKSSTKLPTLADDEPLRTGRYLHLNAGANGKESYASMPNPLFGKELTDGATISFWVKRSDANLLDALLGLTNGDARLYLTGNLYMGFNDGAGKWLDINHPDRVKPTQLGTGVWHLLTVTFDRKATSLSGGVTFYIDGARKSSDNFKGAIDSKNITSKSAFDYNLIVDHLTASPTLYLGYGSFWGSPDVCIDDVIVYDQPLTLTQVMALYSMENRAFDFHSLTSGIADVKRGEPNAPHAVYSLSGQRMGTTTDALPRGLYIVNGKKVVVR